MATNIEMAVGKAYLNLKKHGLNMNTRQTRRWLRLLKHVLADDEEILISARQSYFASLSPAKIIATRKRLLIVRPSFWGLRTGHDITSPTHYIIIPYKYIIGVSISKGLRFASLKLHTSGGIDPGSNIKGEDEIFGIDINYAARMAAFIEEVIEQEELEEETKKVRADQSPHRHQLEYEEELKMGITLEETRKAVGDTEVKVIWLGVEPAESVAKALGIRLDSVIRMSGNELISRSAAALKGYKHIILVSYSHNLPLHTYEAIKDKYGGLRISILNGGLNTITKTVS